MIENRTKAKLEAGGVALGCFVRYANASLAEYIAMFHWDFLVFDCEHGEIDLADLPDLSRAAELRGATPLARVSHSESHVILRALDAGCHGVHVPSVDTPEAAEQVVRHVKYPPRGHRGLAPTRASEWALAEPLGDYTVRANRETLTVVHIESLEAANAVEGYFTIDGLDVLFLGPTDLAQSMGHTGDASHRDVDDIMTQVATAVTRSSMVLGVFVSTIESALEWVDRGARYIVTGVDGLLSTGMGEFVESIRGTHER